MKRKVILNKSEKFHENTTKKSQKKIIKWFTCTFNTKSKLWLTIWPLFTQLIDLKCMEWYLATARAVTYEQKVFRYIAKYFSHIGCASGDFKSTSFAGTSNFLSSLWMCVGVGCIGNEIDGVVKHKRLLLLKLAGQFQVIDRFWK